MWWLKYRIPGEGHTISQRALWPLVPIAILIWLALTGCTLFGGDQAETLATATVTIPTPGNTPTPEGTVQAQATEEVGPPPLVTLNIWFVDEVFPENDTPDGTILAEQLAAFDTGHLNLTLNIENKTPSGQGGTLSYLRTGRGVAPSALPDLIVLPTELLVTAASEDLIYSLDELITTEMKEDLFPAASSLSQAGGQVFGYPFALSNLTHMANRDDTFGELAPATWDELLDADDATFIFPGGGSPGAELALQFYLASGGTLMDDAGQPILEVEPLTAALGHFTRGRIRGLVPLQSSNMTTFDQSWEAYQNGSANTVQTDSEQFLVERGAGPESGFAGLPGIEEPLVPLIKGWAYAISTPDPARQALTAELLGWLTEGANLGEWSLAAMTLPSRRSAFEQWPQEDEYTSYLQEELERAEAFPDSANNTIIAALSEAVFDVLTLAKPPQSAAEDAAASLLQ